jgi:hypothetical protein
MSAAPRSLWIRSTFTARLSAGCGNSNKSNRSLARAGSSLSTVRRSALSRESRSEGICGRAVHGFRSAAAQSAHRNAGTLLAVLAGTWRVTRLFGTAAPTFSQFYTVTCLRPTSHLSIPPTSTTRHVRLIRRHTLRIGGGRIRHARNLFFQFSKVKKHPFQLLAPVAAFLVVSSLCQKGGTCGLPSKELCRSHIFASQCPGITLQQTSTLQCNNNESSLHNNFRSLCCIKKRQTSPPTSQLDSEVSIRRIRAQRLISRRR